MAKFGVETVGHFLLYTYETFLAECAKPLIVVTAKDKGLLEQARKIVEERIEEVELY
jgi:hypothetical protein